MCLTRMMKHGGMELYEFHVGHRSLGTIHHGDTVTRSNHGVRGGLIDGTTATRTHHRDLRQVRIHLLGIRVQHIGTVAVDIRCATCHLRP